MVAGKKEEVGGGGGGGGARVGQVKFSASSSGETILPGSFSIFSTRRLFPVRIGDASTLLSLSQICLLLSRRILEEEIAETF